MRRLALRSIFAVTFGRAATPALALVIALLLVGPTAAAQSPATTVVGYGKTVMGEVTSPRGNEHFFTGCVGETLTVTVAADDADAPFAPRVEIFDANSDEALASAAAETADSEVTLADVALPASGEYVVVVSGRSRADRGPYMLTLNLELPEGAPHLDGTFPLNLIYGDATAGTLTADGVEAWRFRGCDGDEIEVEVVADGFVPEVELFAPIAEFAIATATVEESDDQAVATFARALPHNGEFEVLVSGDGATDAGDYTLTLTLAGRTAPNATPNTTPTATTSAVPEATPTPTATSGPRPRRGVPTPQGSVTPATTVTRSAPPTITTAPTATATPTPTPAYIMPGIGEEVFEVIDVSSRGGPVNFVAYSPDGSVIAVAGEDGTVRVYDPDTGRALQTLNGHTARVNHLAFSPNGSWLASAGDDGAVRLWDEDGVEAITLTMPDESVLSVAFSPDSQNLVATTAEGAVIVWDVATEAERFTLEGHSGPVYAATYSPNGQLIATGDSRGAVRLWDAESGELRDTIPLNAGPGAGDPILSLAFNQSSDIIVAGGVSGVNPGTVQAWNLLADEWEAELIGHDEWGSTATISPDDTFVLSAGRAEPGHDGPVPATVRLWDGDTGDLRIVLLGYPNSVVAATFSPDGDEIMTSDGNYVYIWPMAMVNVITAAYGEPVGVNVPVPTLTATPRATVAPSPTRAATPTLIPTATLTPTPEIVPTATPFLPTGQLETFCTVTTDRLNLRPGPGTNFDPPITVLETGAFMVVIGRNADSSWLQVAVLDDNLIVEFTGWVSADFVFCVGDLEGAPIIEVEVAP